MSLKVKNNEQTNYQKPKTTFIPKPISKNNGIRRHKNRRIRPNANYIM